MKIAIFGAGATGAHFAVRLARAGHEVSVIARGPNLEAIRANGITLRNGDEELHASVPATDAPADLGPQDVVLVGVKATGLRAIQDSLPALIGPDTLVVFPQNGIPWWYGTATGDLPPVPELPDFALAPAFLAMVPAEQIVGGVIYSGNIMEAPGITRCTTPKGSRIELAGIVQDNAETEARVAELRAAFIAGGMDAPEVADIRHAVWRKLMMNMSGSVIALTVQSSSESVRDDPDLAEIYRRTVREGMAVAAAHHMSLDGIVDPDALLARLTNHTPSLVQDYLQGRPMEIDQLLKAPQAFARQAGVPTPTLDTLVAIGARLARDRGLY